jgi:hypothetical protein
MPDPQEFWNCLNALADTLVPDDALHAAEHQEAILRDYVTATEDGQRAMRVKIMAVQAALAQLSDELRSPRM